MRLLLGQWAIGQIRDFGYFISGVTHDHSGIDPLLITERSMTWSTQSKVCDLYLEYQTNKNQDPPIAPIHGVINSTTESIERLRVAMRRVLIRTRLLTPLPRVQAVDSACLACLQDSQAERILNEPVPASESWLSAVLTHVTHMKIVY